jgi:hypothetical protein
MANKKGKKGSAGKGKKGSAGKKQPIKKQPKKVEEVVDTEATASDEEVATASGDATASGEEVATGEEGTASGEEDSDVEETKEEAAAREAKEARDAKRAAKKTSAAKTKKTAKSASVSPAKSAAASPAKTTVVKGSKDTGEFELKGLETYVPLFKKGKFAKIGVPREVFWNASKPGKDFDKDNYDTKKYGTNVDAARTKFYKEDRYKLYKEPYVTAKGSKSLKKMQEFNFQLCKALTESIAKASFAFGKYGDKATLSYNALVAVPGKKDEDVEETFKVTFEEYKYAVDVLNSRLDIGLALERERSKKDPNAAPTGKFVKSALTPNAIDWVNAEQFTTDYFEEPDAETGERTNINFKEWLLLNTDNPNYDVDNKEDRKNVDKIFAASTFAGRGILSKNDYNRLIHLALEKEKDFTSAPGRIDLDGEEIVAFTYTDALKALNESPATFVFNGPAKDRKQFNDNKKTTVADALTADGGYSAEALPLKGVYKLITATSYSKDKKPKDKELLAFLEWDNWANKEAFLKEKDAIDLFFKTHKPIVDAASKERIKKVNKDKRAAAKAEKAKKTKAAKPRANRPKRT